MGSKETRGRPPVQRMTQLAEPAQNLPLEDSDLHIPLSSQAVFWRPRYQAASPMLGQMPFLFWLVESVRPSTVLQIGLGDGMVYMGLCQASERIGASTFCVGMAADNPVMPPAALAQHNDQYGDSSRLVRSSMGDALATFDGEIDLLILNKPLDHAEQEELRKTCLPRLSERAAVLLCNPQTIFTDPAAQGPLFSIEDRVHIGRVSPEGHDIDLVLVGRNPPKRLTALAGQSPGKPAYLASRQVFNRLGQGLEAGQRVLDATHREHRLQEGERAAKASLHTQSAEIDTLRKEVAAARAAETLEISRQAGLYARLTDLEGVIAQKEATIVALNTQLDGARHADTTAQTALRAQDARIAALEAQLGAQQATGTDLVAQLESAQGAERARAEEITALNRLLEGRQTAHAQDCGEKDARIAALEAQLDAQQATGTDLAAQLEHATLAEQERIEDIAILGRLLEDRQSAHALTLQDKDTRISQLEADLAVLQALQADLTVQLGHAGTAERTRADEITAHSHILHTKDARITDLETELEALQTAGADLAARLEDAMAMGRTRVEDIAVLGGVLQEQQAAHLLAIREKDMRIAGFETELGKLKSTLTTTKKTQDALQHRTKELETQRAALMSSTSWKVTKPLRGAKLIFTRR